MEDNMKQYNDRATTPLAFHAFFRFCTAPVGFLLALGNLIKTASNTNGIAFLNAIDLIYFSAVAALLLACFIGFFGWKPYAWKCVMAYLCLNSVYALYCVVIYAIYLSFSPIYMGTAVGQFIGVLVYSILVGIYYYKRKPLFFETDMQTYNGYAQPCSGQSGFYEYNANGGTPAASPSGTMYCASCGSALPPNSAFCGNCGAPVSNRNEEQK